MRGGGSRHPCDAGRPASAAWRSMPAPRVTRSWWSRSRATVAAWPTELPPAVGGRDARANGPGVFYLPGLRRRVRRRRRSPPVVPCVRRAGTSSSGRTGSARCTRQAAASGRTTFDRKHMYTRRPASNGCTRTPAALPQDRVEALMRYGWATAHGDLWAREQLHRLRSPPRWPVAPRSETRAVPPLERFGGLLRRWAGSDNGHSVNRAVSRCDSRKRPC